MVWPGTQFLNNHVLLKDVHSITISISHQHRQSLADYTECRCQDIMYACSCIHQLPALRQHSSFPFDLLGWECKGGLSYHIYHYGCNLIISHCNLVRASNSQCNLDFIIHRARLHITILFALDTHPLVPEEMLILVSLIPLACSEGLILSFSMFKFQCLHSSSVS